MVIFLSRTAVCHSSQPPSGMPSLIGRSVPVNPCYELFHVLSLCLGLLGHCPLRGNIKQLFYLLID